MISGRKLSTQTYVILSQQVAKTSIDSQLQDHFKFEGRKQEVGNLESLVQQEPTEDGDNCGGKSIRTVDFRL